MPQAETSAKQCLVGVTLDPSSLGGGSPDQEHERAVAIYDLIERNRFVLPGHAGGPYLAHLAMVERRLVFEIREADGGPVITHHLSLTPFRGIVKDYAMVCESYYAAIRTATASQIEAIDMGRRGLHDEAAAILVERLAGKVEIDFDTARRLFTLIYALHWKG
ncbi:MAG: UPF0262 family protein [Bosea sp. (in: a-proteobacteria)]|uniref:UPF0262 family protein n=1 Tax=Bosea sp. (in: a-proteobacteria) TaxID=1871050 RepID=UPI00273408E6|nr:UPF0262 family protein [Bosea sp. (in: a-proteobacteria)]MDP3255760.1 UPF0262 family protein [Bosea sp. (in: a-proteobacteria)]MDP3321405.1 UPF0262 family protein [Bosea sp. (in: a-proteobacteria)]